MVPLRERFNFHMEHDVLRKLFISSLQKQEVFFKLLLLFFISSTSTLVNLMKEGGLWINLFIREGS